MKRRELPVGTTVGDAYRIVRRIGEGARGTAYEAHDLRRDGRCVLKLMDGVIAESAEALATFHSQAEIASRPLHPQLVPVLDFGTAATGEPFVVSPLLEGEDLAARQRRQPSPRFEPPLVGHWLEQAAGALAAAHRQGLYHLGLKPTNLFLVPRPGETDLLHVLDFGLSQVDNALALEHPTKLEDSLPYVSPEQSGGLTDPLDDRCDQWALGCIAWQLLTGRPPFAGADATALLYQIGFEDPQPHTAILPDTIVAVLDTALSKRPEDRFADVTEFARALSAATGPLPPARRPRKKKRQDGSASAPAPASGVFLPGVTPRQPESPRRVSAAAPTRLQGLRVKGANDSTPVVTAGTPTPIITVNEADLLTSSTSSPASSPPPALSALSRLTTPLRALSRRQILLYGGVPAGLGMLALGIWGALRHSTPKPVSVERPAGSPPPPGGKPPRPTIVPIRPSSAALRSKRTRKRARRARRRRP